MTLAEGFEMKTLPEMDKNRIKINMEEGRSPKFMGEFKLYVGNISFESTEADLLAVFSEVGTVGDIALVKDELGRNRGFGFVTMRTKGDGEKAMESLDGKEMNGRSIAVRESNS
jgi:RNA recognition motif-containing protein